MSELDDKIEHYGTPRHSGRYPWGSGKNPQRSKNWLQRAEELEKQGLSQKEVAKAFNMSTYDYRAQKSIAKSEVTMDKIRQCVRLKDTGMSDNAIAKETGLPVSTVRSYLDPTKEARVSKSMNQAKVLSELLTQKPYLDVGEGVNRQLGISEEQMKIALSILQKQGYNVYTIPVEQATNPMQKTTMKVLTKGDISRKDVFENRDKITSPDGIYFEDYGSTVRTLKPIPSVDSSRIKVNYAEEGGSQKDGVIEVRPGVADISLGGRPYAQVRIMVDGTHYMKGMAVYNSELPEGVDIAFNTNKHEGTPMLGSGSKSVLKAARDDPTNPFGASFRQFDYIDKSGEKKTSPINIVNDDEDYEKWDDNLSSQFLSKQPPQLANRQLNIDYSGREFELKQILDIPNPTVKRQLLETFADECDSAAWHLKGAALPRQGTYTILPVSSLGDNEVYAPNYKNGEEVILVRYPHAGTFEIPKLRVNNNNPEAVKNFGNTLPYAIGINANVAQKLSGADYDGDRVVVMPTQGQKFKVSPTLEGLKDFDPKELYKKSDDAIPTGKGDGFWKGREMGLVSNLLTDMQIKNATEDEVARAVRHSMVVIDAEKHNLDWRASAIDNDIRQLYEKYQGNPQGGGSTLISQRKRTLPVNERTEYYSPSGMSDEEYQRWTEGKKVYNYSGKTHLDKKGNVVPNKVKYDEQPYKILEIDDARQMSSGYYIEEIYANYANKCKALADRARAELRKTGNLKMNPEAKATYADEVNSLNEKLNWAALNAPIERQAQVLASKQIELKIQADPSLKDKDKDSKERLRKIRKKEIDRAREALDKKRRVIDITPKEWEAIQAGAISDTKLSQILRYADIGKVRALATPRDNLGMSSAAKSLARQLLKAGYPQAVVAERVGVSTTTLAKEFSNYMDIGGEG